MPRLARITDSLSPDAQAILARGFAAGVTAAAIVGQIQNSTGEAVSERTVSRRNKEWREARQRRQTAAAELELLLEAEQAHGASEPLIALARQALEDGVLTSSARNRACQTCARLRRKVKVMEAKIQAIGAAIASEASPEEQLAQVRAIYGG